MMGAMFGRYDGVDGRCDSGSVLVQMLGADQLSPEWVDDDGYVVVDSCRTISGDER